MKNEEQNIQLLRNLIWEQYFRHEGDQPEVWKNKHCTRLSELLVQRHKSGAPISKTIYNFSRKNSASPHTLSALVDAVYWDNNDFTAFWTEKYFAEFENLWGAFQDYSNQQILVQSKRDSDPATNEETDELSYSPVKLPDPLLFISKLIKGNRLLLFLFFFVIYDVAVIVLSLISNSWIGIDYPLSQSYTVWIGYVFFAAVATVFCLFSREFSYLLNFVGFSGEKIIRRLTAKSVRLWFLILALLISGALHYSFLTDDIHGWCEFSPGKISILGAYHTLLYAFNLWIVFLYIFYLMHIGTLVKAIGEANGNSQSGFSKYAEKLLPAFSALNIYYKIIILCFGGFSILFIITTFRFISDSNAGTPFFWHWIEIAILVVLFVVFGFVLYWQYFVRHISNYLISERNKQLLHSNLSKHEVISAITLPVTPDEINKHTSGYLNILIWVVSIIILILTGGLLL